MAPDDVVPTVPTVMHITACQDPGEYVQGCTTHSIQTDVTPERGRLLPQL
jgi:hypothetical protein